MSDFMYLDCYLELPEPVINMANSLNEMLVSRFSSSINFNGQAKPHITLYMGLFPISNRNKIVDVFSNSMEIASPCRLLFSDIRFTEDGYVFFDLSRSEDVQKLHEKVIELLNPLRKGLVREKYLQNSSAYNEKESLYINKFGFPWLFDLYAPHLTLGKISFEQFEREKVLCEIKEIIKSMPGWTEFFPSAIAIGNVGNNGTVVSEPIAEIRYKKSVPGC